MSWFSDLRLQAEVRWMFKVKARFYRHTSDETILMQLPEKSYEVDCLFRKGQYQVHALFSKGYNEKGFIQGGRWDKVVEVGKLLAAGYRIREIADIAGVQPQTVSTLRDRINEYRGIMFRCRCGDLTGHQNTKKCYPDVCRSG